MAKPVYSIRRGVLQLAAWLNVSEDGRKSYSFKLVRRYKDKQTQEWTDSPFLFDSDLPVAAALLQKAYSDLCIQRSGDNAAGSSAHPCGTATPAPEGGKQYLKKNPDGSHTIIDEHGDRIPF